jgi:uncharacterized protein YdcH (DUF465 family)
MKSPSGSAALDSVRRSPPFRENAIDGAMLVTLSKEDLTGDLGLSNLQTKKVLNSLESTKQITGSGGGDTTELQAEVDTLKQENEKLKAEITSLKAPKQVAPAPAQHQLPSRLRLQKSSMQL